MCLPVREHKRLIGSGGYTYMCIGQTNHALEYIRLSNTLYVSMGWLRLVGSLTL